MGGLRNYDKKEIRFMVHKRLSGIVIAMGCSRGKRMNEPVVIITLGCIFQKREETDARMDSKN